MMLKLERNKNIYFLLTKVWKQTTVLFWNKTLTWNAQWLPSTPCSLADSLQVRTRTMLDQDLIRVKSRFRGRLTQGSHPFWKAFRDLSKTFPRHFTTHKYRKIAYFILQVGHNYEITTFSNPFLIGQLCHVIEINMSNQNWIMLQKCVHWTLEPRIQEHNSFN